MVYIIIYKAFCFNDAQSRVNTARNESQTHSCRFGSLAFQPLHHPMRPINGVYIYSHVLRWKDTNIDLTLI